MTVEKVIAMIDALYADMSCTKEETREKLEWLLEHIQSQITALVDM